MLGIRWQDAASSILLLPVLMLPMLGCAAGRAGSDTHVSLYADYERLKERAAMRNDSTHTASYRVRWRARGVEPHAEVILHIDYRAPGRFHIVGKGPLDVLVFTAWVVDSQFVLVDHQAGATRSGRLSEFWAEELPREAPTFGELLRLFTGDCGADIPDTANLMDGPSHGRLTVANDRLAFDLDLRKGRLIRAFWGDLDKDLGAKEIHGEARFGSFSDRYPFWQLRSGYWKDPEGQGEYRWEVLAQKFNHELPERLFTPPRER